MQWSVEQQEDASEVEGDDHYNSSQASNAVRGRYLGKMKGQEARTDTIEMIMLWTCGVSVWN